MKYFKISMKEVLRVGLLDKQEFTLSDKHVTRYTNQYVLYVVTKGELTLKHNDDVITLCRGDIFLFNKGDFQMQVGTAICEYWYVHFMLDDIEFVEADEKEYNSQILKKQKRYMNSNIYSIECYDNFYACVRQHIRVNDGKLFEHITEILKKNRLTAAAKFPETRLEISTQMQKLLMKLETIDTPHREKSYYKSVEIARYIEQHFSEPISAERIEKLFFVNYDYANRMFEKNMQYSILKYRNITRINYAKIRLSTTNMPINKIATEVGFENEQYFSRIFKKYEGVSPSVFRKNQQRRENV